MTDEYKRGQEIGEIKSDVKTALHLLEDHIDKQEKWNDAMNKRVGIAEAWIQTTTGKVVILTSIFSVVGTLTYMFVNWIINHKN